MQIPHLVVEHYNKVAALDHFICVLGYMSSIVGANIFVPNYKFNGRSVALIVVTHLIVISYIFVVFSNESIVKKIEGLTILFVILQGLYKFYTGIFGSKGFYSLLVQIRKLHVTFTREVGVKERLKKVVYHCVIVLELLFVCYAGVILSYFAFPIFMWLEKNEQVLILPIHFQFIDWRNALGYTINTFHQTVALIFGIFGILTADMLFMYYSFQSIAYIEVFRFHIDQLNKLIEHSPENMEAIESKLQECIKAHQEFLTYIKQINIVVSNICLVQLVTSQFIISFSLFLILWSKWIIGPFMTLAGLFQMCEYCILGTIVTVQNENALYHIYDIKWYLLPVRLQNDVLLLLLFAQNTTELQVGKFAKVNMETCMTVLSKTYSCLMMMLKFIK